MIFFVRTINESMQPLLRLHTLAVIVTILFFEDTHAPPYYVDGQLTQLRHAGKLDKLAGVGVLYPGLADHPGHALAKRQMHGFAGIVSLRAAGAAHARRMRAALFRPAPNELVVGRHQCRALCAACAFGGTGLAARAAGSGASATALSAVCGGLGAVARASGAARLAARRFAARFGSHAQRCGVHAGAAVAAGTRVVGAEPNRNSDRARGCDVERRSRLSALRRAARGARARPPNRNVMAESDRQRLLERALALPEATADDFFGDRVPPGDADPSHLKRITDTGLRTKLV